MWTRSSLAIKKNDGSLFIQKGITALCAEIPYQALGLNKNGDDENQNANVAWGADFLLLLQAQRYPFCKQNGRV
jgi:hypothetical protein